MLIYVVSREKLRAGDYTFKTPVLFIEGVFDSFDKATEYEAKMKEWYPEDLITVSAGKLNDKKYK